MILRRSIFILIAVILASCDDVEDLLTFHFNDSTTIVVESASPLNLPVEIATPAVTSNSQQQYENNNTRADLVRDVKLEELKLTIVSPEGKTFSFLRDIHIFISAEGEDEIELASLQDITSSSQVLDLVPTTEKLDAYARSSSYSLRTQVTTDETLVQDVEVQVDLKFRVTADTF